MGRIKAWQWIDLFSVVCVWGTVVLTLVLIAPTFKGAFASFGKALPIPARCVFIVSDFMTFWWIPIVCVATAALCGLQLLARRVNAAKAPPTDEDWKRIGTSLVIALGCLAFVLIWWALTSPIFQCCSLVGQ